MTTMKDVWYIRLLFYSNLHGKQMLSESGEHLQLIMEKVVKLPNGMIVHAQMKA